MGTNNQWSGLGVNDEGKVCAKIYNSGGLFIAQRTVNASYYIGQNSNLGEYIDIESAKKAVEKGQPV